MTDETVFIAALEKSSAERKDFLASACANDPEQRQRIEQLLAGHDRGAGILDQSAVLPNDKDQSKHSSEQAGVILSGRYKLLEEIGEGGMGSVWVAAQLEPVRRKVAVKLVKAGMDTRSVLARFEAERQALALMDHPSIAKVLDGGTTDTGRPYFVMEYVKGVPITKYADDARLSIAERLALFVPVCQAVQHAHTKGIIHRDLKPSNILVCLYDGQPVPKVIDFGLAKAIHQPLTDRMLHTAHGAMLGTPLYMSPEQAEFNNLDVDTRSDIYALGVVLYELLTGTTPLERDRFRRAAWDEMLRMIRDEEPQRPSTRLSGSGSLPSVAAQRQLEPVRLTRLIRGELDWIVMKCLEKDRSRRYDTANGLARDVERYLSDEPVEACPPSAGYRLRKVARKYRAVLVTAATIAMLLIGGTVVSVWQAVRATRAEVQAEQDRQAAVAAEIETAIQRDQAVAEKKRADEERAIALAVSDFLRKDLLGQADIENQPGDAGANRDPNITVRTALDRAAGAVSAKFAGQPLTEAAVRLTIAEAYMALGRYPEARTHVERSVELRTAHLGANHAETLTSRDTMASVLYELGLVEQAEKIYREVLEKRTATLERDHPDTLTSMHNLAFGYLDRHLYKQAAPLLREVVQRRTARLGPNDPATLASRLNLAWLNFLEDKQQQAAVEIATVVTTFRAAHGPDHPGLLNALHMQGIVYKTMGKYAEAESTFRSLLEQRIALQGPTHIDVLICKKYLALAVIRRPQPDEGVRMMEEVINETKTLLGMNHRLTSIGMMDLAFEYTRVGQPAKAVLIHEELLAHQRAEQGPGSGAAILTTGQLARARLAAGEVDAALPLYAEYIAGQRTRLGADSVPFAHTLMSVGQDLMGQRRGPAAEKYLRESLVVHKAKQPAHWATFATESLLGETLIGQKRYDEAESLLLSGYAGLKTVRPLPPVAQPYLPATADRLIRLYDEWGKSVEAAKWQTERLKYPKTLEVLPPPSDQ